MRLSNGSEMTVRYRPPRLEAPFALPAGFAAFLAVGTMAAGLHGRLPAAGVLIACAVVTGVMSFAAEPIAAIPLAAIGWLTAIGFSRPPYAQLRPTGTAAVDAAIVLGASALAGTCLGLLFRWYARRLTLVSMGTFTGQRPGRPASRGVQRGRGTSDAEPGSGTADLAGGIDIRRRL